MSKRPIEISLIIPVYNESLSIKELSIECVTVLKKMNLSFEVIFIDDGSSDQTWEMIQKMHKKYKYISGIRFQKNHGKSAALSTGFFHAKGKYIFTIDGDLQDDPQEIIEMYALMKKNNWDLISGWKKMRYDNIFTKNIPSKIFNSITRRLSRIQLHDFNCGLKGYKKEVIKNIEVYSDMHRYIPLLAKWQGYNHIGEKIIKHRPRKYGNSKFGINRFWNGIIDIILIMFMGKFGKKPIQLFGLLGLGFITISLLIFIYLIIGKFIFQAYEMTKRPIFYLAIISIIIGVQIFMTGFIAELILRNSSDKNGYKIKNKV